MYILSLAPSLRQGFNQLLYVRTLSLNAKSLNIGSDSGAMWGSGQCVWLVRIRWMPVRRNEPDK